MAASALKIGATKSCGCLTKFFISKTHSNSPELSAKNKYYGEYKRSAQCRNLEFKLSFEEFEKITSDDCHYCGIAPNYIKHIKTIIYGDQDIYFNGIDRKDNSIGYTITNSVACCTECNYRKRALPYEEFINWINRIIKFRSGQQ